MNQVRAGIIGCGGIANGKHLPALHKMPDVSIIAFCDINIERATIAAQTYGTPDAAIYTDYQELLNNEEIDAVYVLTPNRSHSFITIDALHAGKHVMCEKPMAKTYAEAQKMVQAANETGKLLTIGYQNRCLPESLYLKELTEADELGDIYYAKAHAVRRRAVPTWGVFLNEYEQGGGPLIDIGTHALDMTLWQMNNYRPKMVLGTSYKKLGSQAENGNAWGDWNPEDFTVEDSAFGFIVMENGATINLESSWALNILDGVECKTSLCGTKAGADMLDGLRINGIHHNMPYITKPTLTTIASKYAEGGDCTPSALEARNFINAITKGTPLRVLPEQALIVTQILEGIYESAKTGKPFYFV